MKRVVVMCLLLAGLLGTAGAASAAANPLAKQVAALQKQSKLQQKQITALTTSLSSLKSEIASSGITTLGPQVTALQGTVNTINATVNTVSATLTCRVAQLGTLDLTFIDLFEIIGGQPESYAGQVVPDNGTCAQVGLTPPSPAQDRFAPAASPTEWSLRAMAQLLGTLNR
jgi:hypothetical protein